MPEMTPQQQKALAALYLLHQDSRMAGFRRWDIARISKGDCSSYPLKTMRALQRLGYVQPLEDVAVELVEQKICRCGCDLWKITIKGFEKAQTFNIANAPRGRLSSIGLSVEQAAKILEMFRRLFGLGAEPEDPADWWKKSD